MSGDLITYPQAIIGYRVWMYAHGELESIGMIGKRWLPGSNEASCVTNEDHDSPVSDCMCGLYAFHSLKWALAERAGREGMFSVTFWPGLSMGETIDHRPKFIVGAVCGSGRVEIHRDGWRAERAQTLALLRPPAGSATRREREVYERIAKEHSIPIADSAEELVLIAERAGDPITEDVFKQLGVEVAYTPADLRDDPAILVAGLALASIALGMGIAAKLITRR